MGKLRREKITATRPQCYSVLVSASQTAIAVEFDFVKPVLALWNALHGEGIHRAVHDRMLPLLGIGERLHPELDEAYLTNPDQTI